MWYMLDALCYFFNKERFDVSLQNCSYYHLASGLKQLKPLTIFAESSILNVWLGSEK